MDGNSLLRLLMFTTLGLFVAGGYATFVATAPGRRRVRRRLRTWCARKSSGTTVEVIRRQVLSDIPWFNRLLIRIPPMRALGRLLEQANSPWTVGVFLLLALLLFCLGLFLASVVFHEPLVQIGGALIAGGMPFFYIYYRKRQQLRKFERQLPEALDLVARALQAGHPFLVGMKLVADEFTDPISTEFATTIEEINFGVGVPDALKNLSLRVDCADLRFFVISVLVQRETGGNLAEILAKTSHLMRQRFELQGRIRALAAEGKLSAVILCVLPFVMALVIHALNPDYLTVLFTDPTGRKLVVAASVLMALGVVVIRNMIRIKV
jgi:tight adherence protein B